MSERKHTPGPWLLAERTVYALNDKGINRFSALVQDAHAPAYELNANARLIAAAPDLLEVAKTALLYANSKGNDLLSNMAERAIAKATGESK